MITLPSLVLLLAGLCQAQAKLEASTDEVFLQPGESKTVTLISNCSGWSSVFLRTKLHHIATVAPARQDVGPTHPWWEVSNCSGWSSVFLRTKLHHIATVAPARQDVGPTHPCCLSRSNCSGWSSVFLRTKLHHIATVAPARQDVGPTHPWWEVQITGHELGYTHIIAAINQSRSFSFEEGLIHITVLKKYWLQTLSLVCGWIYFSAWTFSFYPQLLTNIRRKSVVGLNFDFLGLNELGYVCYSIFNCCLYFVPSIQDEYFKRHPGATNPVFFNDVLFSVHGLLATTVMIMQCFVYKRGGQTVSQTAVALLSVGICALGGLLLLASQHCISWLDAVVWISFIKLMVTMTKYIPQALMHFRHKTTEGWSIECILCDLTGSCFSLFQMLINAYNCDDWVSILGDPTKFGLGLFSIGFDMLFIVQHFVLYRIKPEKDAKEKETPKSIFIIFKESILPNISKRNKN
ncbi:cystinosin homolog [Macrosteles quadrilineatus]|uniref:cystinosin homolog n=1 Tax=Macrosteles quadrilineatus TaxID=74068 RepID=UPI0023E2B602|nr:cystinosin homolog [Macrosteles quadrilineatus]